jgi:aminoglycoside phosphotransferase (APT) family kinase protein
LSGTPDLGPVPTRVPVEIAQVRRLVRSQFPQWADLPITPVAQGGWDNWTFHLGDDMVARLPSAAEYAQAVEKEHRWLPRLAHRLPLPIPTPVGLGTPSAGYPHPWSVYGWLEGRPARVDRIADPVTFAADVATFASALRAVDPSEGPQPGIHNWFRGGPLRTFDANTRSALRDLESHIDVDRTHQVWTDALKAPWDGVDYWVHGDLAGGNLLLDDAGELAAVIDFGTCGVGDPACDLAVAWTLLTSDGREAFRDRLAIDTPTWTRGRGWALWKAVATCRSTFEDPDDIDEFNEATRVLGVLLDE